MGAAPIISPPLCSAMFCLQCFGGGCPRKLNNIISPSSSQNSNAARIKNLVPVYEKNAAAFNILEEDVGWNCIILILHPPPKTQTPRRTTILAPSLRDVNCPPNFGGGYRMELHHNNSPSSSQKLKRRPEQKYQPRCATITAIIMILEEMSDRNEDYYFSSSSKNSCFVRQWISKFQNCSRT